MQGQVLGWLIGAKRRTDMACSARARGQNTCW